MVTGIRRFRRRGWRRWLLALTAAVFVLLRIGFDRWQADPDQASPSLLAEGLYQVARVVDGDTLLVRSQPGVSQRAVRVRLLGIDCPESVRPGHPVEPWALEAAQFTRDFVSGHAVRLRFDRRRLDKYRRHLAYVYVNEQMLNEELVRAGLAKVLVFAGDAESIARRLRAAESEAKRNRRGLWSAAG